VKRNEIADLLGAYCILFLLLIAAGSFFVFVINWEDWFFGIKLDGWPAGLYLLSKAVIAALLVFLLVKDPKRRIVWDAMAVLFFAFVFILPVFTIQRNLKSSLGWAIFWIECVLFLLIPAVLIALWFIVDRNKPDNAELP